MALIFSSLALVLVVADYFGLLSATSPRTPRLPVILWLAVIVVSFVAEIAIALFAAQHQVSAFAYRASEPIAVLDDRGAVTLYGDALTATMLLLASVQSYALLSLYRARVTPRLFYLTFGMMLFISLAAPVTLSFDPFYYVGIAMRGSSAYLLTNPPFHGSYAVLDLWWPLKDRPLREMSVYGPGFTTVVRAVTVFGTTLAAKFFAWRVFCSILYVAMILGFRALKVPSRVIVVAALNPALMLQYIVSAHNDLLAVVLLVWAAHLLRRHPLGGFICIAVAGLIKIPYLALALPLLTARRPLARFGAFAATALFVLAVSWLAGGSAYAHALMWYARAKPMGILQICAAGVALLTLTAAALHRRRLRAAVWLLPSMSAWLFPWYFLWSVPYALRNRRVLSYLLVCLPVVTMVVESTFARYWEVLTVIPVLLLLCFWPQRRSTSPPLGVAAT